MTNPNRPFGLQPFQKIGTAYVGQTNRYWIPSTDTDAYFVGDAVISGPGADANGVPQIGKAAADSPSWRGVLTAIEANPNNLAQTTIPATKDRDYYVEVADDPSTEFLIQDDGVMEMSADDVGLTATIAVAAPPGNCPTSATTLDSSTISDVVAQPLLILGSTGGFAPYSRWRTKIRSHDLQQTLSGYQQPGATSYDGIADAIWRSDGLIGVPNGRKGTLCVWGKFDSGAVASSSFLSNENDVFACYLTTGGPVPIAVTGYTSGYDPALVLFSLAALPVGSFFCVLASWDLTAGVSQIYLDDVDVKDEDDSSIADVDIDYNQGGWIAGGPGLYGTPYPYGKAQCEAELFFHPDFIDLSVEANRRKFITAALKPVDLGAQGELPFGAQAAIYMPTADGVNLGYAGAFTPVGAPTACGSHP